MALEETVNAIRDSAIKSGKASVPDKLQGIGKKRIREVLTQIDRVSDDLVDVVFALLDNRHASWFTKAPKGACFSDGASTAHIACHVGILQRGGRKLDREGRDYWIKPLRGVGAVDPVTLDPKQRAFVAGHTVAKSSNSAYRLADDFKAILLAPDKTFKRLLVDWIGEDAIRRRLKLQAALAEKARSAAATKHSDLIAAACEFYVPKFLPSFEVLYIDAEDGERVSAAAKARLKGVGLQLRLEDAMPDVLLVHRGKGEFWVIEAVTSDGEVDMHKVTQVTSFVRRSRPESAIGFTTVYRTWKDAAARQGQY
ncbi:MAG: BsuBI/PstI family type II restriction endonuclease [Candidatus Geothermincolia bacterium]